MLQLTDVARESLAALRAAGEFPPPWSTATELDALADRWVARLREEQRDRAARRGPFTALRERVDALLRTDAPEYLDREDCPDRIKLRIVRALHAQNVTFRSYGRFLRALLPVARRAGERRGRSARILELASGSGEFTMALANLAQRRGLPLEITGSDVVETYVRDSAQRARARGVPVAFRVVNAFDMRDVEPGSFDLAFIAQSIHHFRPGQLARAVAESMRVVGAFVGIDGYRSLLLLGVLGLTGTVGSLTGRSHHYVHDAVLSARKLYSQAELELIAQLAAPWADVRVEHDWPAFSVLTVESPR